MSETLQRPRLVIAGAASGAGKTTAMVSLCRALRERGLKIAVFKCGPDYLDPTYHARAAGVPCHNLDGWMMGHEAVRGTFSRASEGADVALIEGVMGLFDGASPDSDDGSTAQVAKWLDAPVVLLLDASGMARTFAAVAQGLARFDLEVRIAGAIANRVGSRGHLALLERAAVGTLPLFGGLPARPSLAFPERHLGLFAADDRVLPDERLHTWGVLAEEWCRLDALLELARSAPAMVSERPSVRSAGQRHCHIAIAQDAAFHFYYADNLRRLEELGAELVPFSPMTDVALPAGIGGLYLGGGYPELNAPALAENAPMRQAVRSFAERGGPVYAECGGLMYLSDAIRTIDGRTYPMVGLIPGAAVMADKLQALGYVEVETTCSSILGSPGLRFRGHQFRYSSLEVTRNRSCPVYRVRRRRGGEVSAEGYQERNVLASYVHAHWASNPLVAAGFVESCARFGGRE